VIEVFVMRTYKKRTAKLGNNDQLTIKLITHLWKPKKPRETRGQCIQEKANSY